MRNLNKKVGGDGLALDAVVAGHLCMDLFPIFKQSPRDISAHFRPGTLEHMGPMKMATGGAVSNTGLAMKKFGLRMGFIARVGGDELGQLTKEALARHGLTAGLQTDAKYGSSYSVVLAPEGLDRMFLHCPGTNDRFTPRDVDWDLVKRSRLFHFGYPTLMAAFIQRPSLTADLMRRAKAAGATTSLDLSLPDPASPAGKANWRRILTLALPHVDIFVPSLEEAFFAMFPVEYLKRKKKHRGAELLDHISPAEVRQLGAAFLKLGAAVAVVKCGPHGWYVRSARVARLEALGRARPKDLTTWAHRELWCPAFQVKKIASATGSGDASIAAFLTSLLRGVPLPHALRMANTAGWMNLRAFDALSGIGSWRETEKMLPKLQPRRNDFLKKDGWLWQGQEGVWERGNP